MTIQQLLKTAPVTALLLTSFIGLYIVQFLTGVDPNNPSTEALLLWGANALPYTMGDEPWRLVSSGFLHIGLMHLLFNGFAMYFFGQVAEPMFGSAKFLALFLLAVIGGNLLNSYITWQSILDGTGQPGLSAGASGGIMGIGAALLIAALFKISVNGMVLNLKSLILIMGINLVYGFAVPGIDNAGHIGGAITGLIIALGFAIAYRQHSQDANNAYVDALYPESQKAADTKKSTMLWQLLPWVVILLIAAGFVWWWQDIHNQILQVLSAVE
ncbi:rhomboid family intramembrane serine protease [uncultured Psychrobacter sp.]|uniref:rhomboid family intramembrane serine protease n=1 Tax=uncultured Psychrobacter sp. TaxID=259303 RepID=UPI00345B3F14